MPNQSSSQSTTPAPAPAPAPKRNRGPINRAYLAEIANARKVANAALDPANAPALTAVELDATLAPDVLALATQIESSLGALTGARAGKKATTEQEAAMRDELLAVIGPIQTAAKRAFTGDSQKLREAYFVGASLPDQTFDKVLAASRAILARLSPGANNTPPQDTLPGIKPNGAIKNLSDAIAAYDQKNTQQGNQLSGAKLSLEQIDSAIATLAEKRHAIQLAADQAWPWRAEGVRTIRSTFLLPADHPLAE